MSQIIKSALGDKVSAISKGFGQIIFLNSTLSGGICFIAMLCNGLSFALLGLVGNITGVLMGQWGDPKATSATQEGLFGFNGTLVGLAVALFRGGDWLAFPITIVGAIMATYLFLLMRKRGIPPFTFPFVAVTWLLLMLSSCIPLLAPTSSLLGSIDGTLRAILGGLWGGHIDPFVSGFSLSYGQIMFLDRHLLCGALLLLAIALYSLRAAWMSVLAFGLTFMTYISFDLPHSSFVNGLWGYNAILCALAFSGKGLKVYLQVCSSVLLSIVFQYYGLHYGITTLTFPFILSVWVILIVDAICMRIKDTCQELKQNR